MLAKFKPLDLYMQTAHRARNLALRSDCAFVHTSQYRHRDSSMPPRRLLRMVSQRHGREQVALELVHDSLVPFSLDKFEAALRSVGKRSIVAAMLLKLIDHCRPIIFRLPKAGHSNETVGGERESKRWPMTSDMFETNACYTYIHTVGCNAQAQALSNSWTYCPPLGPFLAPHLKSYNCGAETVLNIRAGQV